MTLKVLMGGYNRRGDSMEDVSYEVHEYRLHAAEEYELFQTGWQTITIYQFIVNFVLTCFCRERRIINLINLSDSLGVTTKIVRQIVTDMMGCYGGDYFYEQHQHKYQIT